MKRILLLGCLTLLICSCSKTPSAVINATITDADDSTQVVLQKLNYNKLAIVDTIYTDADGKFTYKVTLPNESPNFYYLFCNGSRIAAMILLPKDKVTITADGKGSYEVEGSTESSNLKTIDDNFAQSSAELLNLANETDKYQGNPEKVKEINSQMGKIYVSHKRSAIKHVLGNPKSITSATILFQKFNDNLPVFGEASDVIIFKRVYDSLKVVYPNSEYLVALMDEIGSREKYFEMSNKLSEVKAIGFPDLVLPDIAGKDKILSDLSGKVIILSFWSVSQTEHKMFNNDLLSLYSAYHDKGLEIYQVALDIDKPSWASAVKAQHLPWINVNDGYGINSPSIATYNVAKIPSMFIIDRNGDINSKDVFDKDKLESIIKKLL
ncbi:MAG: TlpA disulfide reductase family protein [Bacteroidales bacterium]|nr:TlpA disulfide reductase family protein [Bacteroidales bacterium]MDD4669905.1 TlpA disulfide reductase family protein [Bacteroidales bacterium]